MGCTRTSTKAERVSRCTGTRSETEAQMALTEEKKKSEDKKREEYVCRANDVTYIGLFQEKGQLENTEGLTYHPPFTHQLFNDEKIYGYKGLRINIYSASMSMFTLFNVQYDEKLEDADDIVGPVAERIAPGFTTDLSEFAQVGCNCCAHFTLCSVVPTVFTPVLQHIDDPFTPHGELIASYDVGGATFEVYRVCFLSDPCSVIPLFSPSLLLPFFL